MNPPGQNKGIDWDAVFRSHPGLSNRVIGRMLGVNHATVHKARQRRGMTSPTRVQPCNTWPSPPDTAPGDDVARLIAAARRGPLDVGAACDLLDCGPTRLRRIVDDAREQGVPLDLQGDRMAWHMAEESDGEPATARIERAGDWATVAVVGDVHFGSRQCRHDLLGDFCRIAYERGARLFLQLGDMLDGEYRHGIRELRTHGFDEQADEVVAHLPRMDGARWLFIDGNHDETFTLKSGAVCGRALVDRLHSAGRDDVEWLGQRRGVVLVDVGLEYHPRIEMWHPKKGPAYALSYHLQKRISDFPVGRKPDLLLVGHWHQFCYVHQRGVHAIAGGTFQGGGSAYGNALGGDVALGGVLLNLALTPGGTLRHVAVERIAYYDQEEPRRVTL